MQNATLLNMKMKPSFAQFLAVAALSANFMACQSTYQHTNETAHESVALTEKPTLSSGHEHLCQDFLSKLNKKPAQLTFEGCSAGFYADHHSIIANYRVAGKHAFGVQEYLHRISGMPRLVKDCCLWESVNPNTSKIGGMIRENGETYFVRMESKELRLGWGVSSDVDKIPEFRVQTIYPLELNYGEVTTEEVAQ